MCPDDEVKRKIEHAALSQRPYAGYYDWPEREIAEWGVAKRLCDVASGEPGFPLQSLQSRGRGNDPPDCEARDSSGRAVAVEVTELVSGEMIAAARRSNQVRWAIWDASRLTSELQLRLTEKDAKQLKGGPWSEYIVIIHTDEPALSIDQVDLWLASHRFNRPQKISRAFLLLSHDPARRACPYVPLQW